MSGCVLRVTHQGRSWTVECDSVEEALARWPNLVKSGYEVKLMTKEEADGREEFDEDEEDSLIGSRVCSSG